MEGISVSVSHATGPHISSGFARSLGIAATGRDRAFHSAPLECRPVLISSGDNVARIDCSL